MARLMAEQSESELYRLAASPSHLLHRAEQLAADRFAQLVGETVTLRQFAVLAAIAEAPGQSQVDLVRATGVDRSTVADMMNRMEKRGWVERTTSKADGRAHSVHLTGLGYSIFNAAMTHARAADATILDLLPRTKAKAFLNTLAKLARLADEARERDEREARRQAKREAREKRREKARGEKNKGQAKGNGGRRRRA